ncbi:hypothetical protein BKA67DRAFT_560451 [Truncatella angustata]|uniref:Chromo domain-containing protein n=1 Tax=Truncatella angustata TaxID=152316 RepID=A0A9P8UNJ1_9PEZI|nr:uncharacterized protein BKA67DRAFT_560451 [Truncatella angustata]KAH6655363.1 hypothetical protein BKA67DRAFT_560451 [Truncatella angustata]
MSPTIPNAATIANDSKHDWKQPAGQKRGVSRQVKKPKRRSIVSSRRKKKKSNIQKAEFWPIKDILEEEITTDGTTRYLVEWEGLDTDEQPYKPEWVQDVTDDALQAWQAKQRGDLNESSWSDGDSDIDIAPLISSSQQVSGKSAQRESTSQTGNDSQYCEETPGRPRLHRQKRRRTVVPDSQDIKGLSLNNNSPSENSGRVCDSPLHKRQKIIVELAQSSSFDPSAYRTVQLSQDIDTQLDVQVNRHYSAQSFSAASPNDHCADERIIPDSQEPSAFSKSDASNNGSQLRAESLGGTLYNTSEVQDQNLAVFPTLQQQDLETSAEIPSRQPDFRRSRQNLQLALEPSFESTIIAPTAAGDERHEIPPQLPELQTSSDSLAFQTQEPFNSQPRSPISPSGLSQINAHGERTESQVALQSFQTLLNPSRYTLSTSGSRSEIGDLSQISSQAAQIVPHTLSQSQGNPSQSHLLRTFSVYNDNQNYDEIIPDSSRQPINDEKDSQSFSKSVNELDGNSKLSSSTPLQLGLVPQPQSVRLLSQSYMDKSSYSHKAYEAKAVLSRPLSLPPSQGIKSGLQFSDRSVVRHSSQPATLTNKMEGIDPAGERRLTAKERMRQIIARNFADKSDNAPPTDVNAQNIAGGLDPIAPPPRTSAEHAEPLTISPALLVPIVEMDHDVVGPAALESKLENVAPINPPVFESTAVGTSYDPLLEEQPATLDPSALTLSIEHDMMEPDIEDDGSPSIPTDDLQPHSDGPDSTDEGLQTNTDVQDVHDVQDVQEPNILPYIDSRPNEFIVTLSLASNIRPQYVEIIKESRDDLAAYNARFTEAPYQAPSPAVVRKVDGVFEKLLDICDLPPFLETLKKIGPDKAAKYIRTTNSKYAFVGHFLDHLSRHASAEKRILIFARPGPIVELLNSLLQMAGMRPEEVLGAPATDSNSIQSLDKSWANEKILVTVYPTGDKPYDLQSYYDVVIAFDHTYRQEFMPVHLNENPPITLVLVTTTSIQHINFRISEKIEPLSRKNYLLLALCASTSEMLSGESSSTEAHQIAEHFAEYINAPYDDDFYWSPQEPSESIFENIAASSQVEATHSSMLPIAGVSGISSRKRSFDEADETEAKRPRMAPAEIVPISVAVAPHIPDGLKGFIGNDVPAIEGNPVVQISVAKAESLAAKMARLEAELEKTRAQRDQFRELADRSKLEVDSWTSSLNRIQPKYMAALRDRGIFQKERDVAVKRQQEVVNLLQSTKDQLTATTKGNADLRTKLSEAQESLLNCSNPELARLVHMEQEVEETRAKFAELDNKAVLANKDRDYAYAQYQQASQGALDLKKDNDELQRQVVELMRKADDNIVKIHDIQRDNETRELVRLLDLQKTIVRDRENELSQARLQLASLKNGRRETRQSSVPRSPRLNVSSPRNQGRRAATETATGTTSRQSSPAAMSTFEVGGNLMPGIGSLFAGQQGNGRFAHLRD